MLAPDGRYVFEIRPPLGWHVPSEPAPPGALRLTVGGLPSRDAPACIMIRAVPRSGESLEAYAGREHAAMAADFPDGSLAEVEGLELPDTRWVARKIHSFQTHQTAMIAVREEADHFVWFGLLVSDHKRLRQAQKVYAHVLHSFAEQSYSALVESLRGIM